MTSCIARLGLIAVAALGATGCTQIRTHQGYIVDTDLVNSVQPGVDNRQSVLQTLGKPTFVAQFDQGDWYYLARDSRNYGFRNPHAINQIALDISFDPGGNVSAIRRSGLDQVDRSTCTARRPDARAQARVLPGSVRQYRYRRRRWPDRWRGRFAQWRRQRPQRALIGRRRSPPLSTHR